MKLILIGFGAVGQGFAEILRGKAAELAQKHRFSPKIVGLVTASKGSLHHPDGLDASALLDAAQAGAFDGYPTSGGLRRNWTAHDMIRHGQADALVEASPTNLQTGQPALDICHLALEQGLHLVLANKGPVALDYARLKAKAAAKGLCMRYEATVMAGTPVMRLAEEALAVCAIRSAQGILNGTTNYILTEMEAGMSYGDALAKAQALGYAETDPSGDVEGWDAAGKALILANALFDVPMTMDDLEISGITKITAADIVAAKAEGQRYKLIATVTAEGGRVGARRLPLSDPLAGVGGVANAMTLETDLMGDITIIGAGAGRLETGFAILSDLLAIHQKQCAAGNLSRR